MTSSAKQPLRVRIVGALALQPMTNNGVARCLSITQQAAHSALTRLCKRGKVRRHGWEKHKGRPAAQLFEITA